VDPNDQTHDNTIGPARATASTSAELENPWGVPLVESRALLRLPLIDQLRTSKFVSYRIATTKTKGVRHTTTIYGVNTHSESFRFDGALITFGHRFRAPRIAEIDAALQLAIVKFGEPLTLTGSEKFIGAVLERAIELNIAIDNPELQDLQKILRTQRGLKAKTQGTSRNGATGQDSPQHAHHETPIVDTTQAETRPIAELINELIPDDLTRVDRLPENQVPGEERLFAVIATTKAELAVAVDDVSYIVIPRTQSTAAVTADSIVVMRAGKDGRPEVVREHGLQTTLEVREAMDEEVFLQRPADMPVPKMNDFTRSLENRTAEEAAVALLVSRGIDPTKIKEVEFTTPQVATSYEVLAMNDGFVSIKMPRNNIAHIDRSKFPLPPLAVGEKLSYRPNDTGTMVALNEASVAQLTAKVARARRTA
jgi:hypothetical protein